MTTTIMKITTNNGIDKTIVTSIDIGNTYKKDKPKTKVDSYS